MIKNFLPETLTLPLPLAGSVSKPKLSHTLKFYRSHYHKENQKEVKFPDMNIKTFSFQLKRFQLNGEALTNTIENYTFCE